MPLPKIHIDDVANGRPRQPIPLRFAPLVVGWSCRSFLGLLCSSVIDDPGLLLKGYEYVNGTTPRSVRRAFYEDLSVSIRPDASASDALKQLPIDHFVWSDELAAAFSNFVENFHEPEDAYRQSMGLEWNPAFHGTEALIAECVDLSSLEDDAGASASQQGDYVFRRSQAGGWEISFEGRKCGPFKDSLGLQYLKQLLQNQNRTVSAMELCAVVLQPDRSDRDAAARHHRRCDGPIEKRRRR